MICSKCGFIVDDGKFCPNCGTAVEKEVQNETIETSSGADDTVDPGKSKGLISLILGIVSLVLGTICSCGCASPLTIITSIVGMILGSSANKASISAGFEKNGKGKIGFILSLISLIVSIFVAVAWTIYAFVMGALGSVGAI